MKYLFDNIQTINNLLQSSKRIILLSDYDGTLTPIREHPELAILPAEIRQLLVKFTQNKTFFLGIITGRSLKQIKKLIRIPKILYVANHGIELEGPCIRFTSAEAKKVRYILWHVYMQLLKTLKQIEGIYIEDKGLSISLHYRLVKNTHEVDCINKAIYNITKSFLDRKMLSLSTGKMVYEIRPSVKWNKASAIQWLLTNYSPLEFGEDVLLVYLGDDKADIEVFTTLKGKGLTVFVGNPSDTSAADYYVHTPEEVKVFLEFLYEQKNEINHGSHTESKGTV